jgi:hypothetical protein
MNELNIKRIQSIVFPLVLITVNMLRLQMASQLQKLYQVQGELTSIRTVFVGTLDALRLITLVVAIIFLFLAGFQVKKGGSRWFSIFETLLWLVAVIVAAVVP